MPSTKHVLIVGRAGHYIFYNILSVIVFGIIYYLLEIYDMDPFVSNRAIKDKDISQNKRFSFIECLHYSLVTQATLGNGGMIPLNKSCIMFNSLQIIASFLITATTIIKKD